MKDLDDNNLLHLDTALRTDFADSLPAHLVQAGDIIFRSRAGRGTKGRTHTAALLRTETTNTIVAAPLFRIRITTKTVLPEYLLWWINQPSSQNYLSSRAEGTAVQMIGKQLLAELKVSVPPVVQQKRIVEIAALASHEQAILDKIKRCKQQLIDKALLQIVSESGTTSSHGKPGNGITESI